MSLYWLRSKSDITLHSFQANIHSHTLTFPLSQALPLPPLGSVELSSVHKKLRFEPMYDLKSMALTLRTLSLIRVS